MSEAALRLTIKAQKVRIEGLEAEIDRLRRAENDAAEWVEERTKHLRADNERLRGIIENVTASWFDMSLGEEHMNGVMDEARRALGEER